jgi:hypothetical protein
MDELAWVPRLNHPKVPGMGDVVAPGEFTTEVPRGRLPSAVPTPPGVLKMATLLNEEMEYPPAGITYDTSTIPESGRGVTGLGEYTATPCRPVEEPILTDEATAPPTDAGNTMTTRHQQHSNAVEVADVPITCGYLTSDVVSVTAVDEDEFIGNVD